MKKLRSDLNDAIAEFARLTGTGNVKLANTVMLKIINLLVAIIDHRDTTVTPSEQKVVHEAVKECVFVFNKNTDGTVDGKEKKGDFEISYKISADAIENSGIDVLGEVKEAIAKELEISDKDIEKGLLLSNEAALEDGGRRIQKTPAKTKTKKANI